MRFIGCKALLLDNIKEVIDKKAPESKTFCDIFSGTASVGRFFKKWYEVSSNDLLYFSYVLQKATIENDNIPQFKTLKNVQGISNPIDYFNQMDLCNMELLPKEKRFFQNTYAPIGGRMYLSNENALRIDYARNIVEEWYKNNILTDNEYFYLVACIVEGIPFVSNISGTYGAFNKIWDKRSYKKFELYNLDVYTNGKNNKSYNQDGAELLKEISGDILYIDPPYNERQYPPNYHVLETAAKYDFPNVRGVTGLRPYVNQKSEFCNKSMVVDALAQLINNARFKHIILSYSTDGLMSLEDIEKTMKKFGKPETYQVFEIPYRRFKSRSLKNNDKLKELIIYIEK